MLRFDSANEKTHTCVHAEQHQSIDRSLGSHLLDVVVILQAEIDVGLHAAELDRRPIVRPAVKEFIQKRREFGWKPRMNWIGGELKILPSRRMSSVKSSCK
jgi:hypothetical protein